MKGQLSQGGTGLPGTQLGYTGLTSSGLTGITSYGLSGPGSLSGGVTGFGRGLTSLSGGLTGLTGLGLSYSPYSSATGGQVSVMSLLRIY